MALSGLIGPGQIIRPRSLILIRTDPIPDLPKSAGAAARLKAAVRAIALIATDIPDPDKWKADVAMSQGHKRALEITDHPVETGFRITDHSRLLPDIVVFSGIVSDTPTTPLGALLSLQQTLFFKSRAHAEFQKFNEFFEDREPLFAATSLRVYPSMLIKEFEVTRDNESGAAIQVDVVLREVQIREEVNAKSLLDDDALFLGAGPGENGGTLALTPSSL